MVQFTKSWIVEQCPLPSVTQTVFPVPGLGESDGTGFKSAFPSL